MPIDRIVTPHTSMMNLFNLGTSGPTKNDRANRHTRNLWGPLTVVFICCVLQEPWVRRTFWEQADDPVCKNLHDWIVAGGGYVRGVKCIANEGGGGRGLRITDKLPAGEKYIELPRSLWMWAETAITKSKIGHLLKAGGDKAIEKACGEHWGDSAGKISPCRLILTMEFEKYQPDSFWATYIATLPENPTALTFWDRHAIDGTQSETLEFLYDSQLSRFTATHAILFPYLCEEYPDLFKNCERHTLHSFMVSAINVKARNFAAYHLDVENETRRRVSKDSRWPTHWSDASTGVLLPYADLSNHDSSLDSPYGDLTRKDWFTLTAANNFDVGSELAFSYGSQHPSGYFVDLYGFIPNGYIKADFVTLKARCKNGHGFQMITGFIGVDGNIIPKDFVNRMSKTWFPDKDDGESRTNEHIMSLIKGHLEDLATSYEDDMAELQQGFKEYKQFVSVNVRTRFKRVWHTTIENIKHKLTKSDKTPFHLRPSKWIMNYETRYQQRIGPPKFITNFALDSLTLTAPSNSDVQ